MPIEMLPDYHVVITLESDNYRWNIFERGDLIKKGDLFSERSRALFAGYYWLTVAVGQETI